MVKIKGINNNGLIVFKVFEENNIKNVIKTNFQSFNTMNLSY